MESLRDSGTGDLSPLAWVQEELRRALETANKAVRRFVKESEAIDGDDTDAVDPSVLNAARQQLHQAAGALRMVGEPAGETVVLAAEAAVQRLIARPEKRADGLHEALEKASFALLDYLQRKLSDKPVSPVAMFPQYRALQALAGAERVHPADLWQERWSWHDLPPEAGVEAREVDADSRAELESALLSLMRHARPETAARLSDLFASLGAGAPDAQAATLWRLAAAFFDAQAHDLLGADNYSKRVGSRLLSQLRAIEQGRVLPDVERLAKDLLFFCAQAASPGDGRVAPRLAEVRRVFGLTGREPVDYEVSRLGRFDPAWRVQARKRVAAAKDAWSSVAAGELHRLSGLNEQFALVGDSLRRLFPSGELLADELAEAIAQSVQRAAAPGPALAMEVATGVLYLEASLEEGDLDHPQQGARIEHLAERIRAVRGDQPGEPLEPWMEELYRRVSDRQTMGTVVQELRHSLGEAERQIDQYFRNPSARESLIPVPGVLSSMRGVLSVLGLDQAAAAVQRMRGEVDELVGTELDPARASYSPMFERLAGNLGALGFLIDMLGVQPSLAKTLFSFDAASGVFAPVMGRSTPPSWTGSALPGVVMPPEPGLVEQAQALAVAAASGDVPADDVLRDLQRLAEADGVDEQPQLAASVAQAQEALEGARTDAESSAAREQLALSIQDFVTSASEPVGIDFPAPAPSPAPTALAIPAAASPAPAVSSGLEEDDEMREVFLEEAREVIDGALEALAELQVLPDDIGQLTTVRRAFHTLKGSSRMVGLADFGEAAWACEQLYNARLAEAPRADEALLGFSHEAFVYLAGWVDGIAARRDGGHASAPVREAADALRLRGERIALVSSDGPEAAPGAAGPELALPAETDLGLAPMTLDLADDAPATTAAAEPPAPAAALPDLDLSSLGDTPAPASDATALPDAGLPTLDFDLDLSALDERAAAAAPERGTTNPSVVTPDEEEAAEPHEATAPMPQLPEPVMSLDGDAGSLDDLDPDSVEMIEIDLADFDAPPVVDAVSPPDSSTAFQSPEGPASAWPAAEEPAPEALGGDDDPFRMVGPLRIGIPLFNIYLNEADELSRRLVGELGEWSMELDRPVGETAIALAHSLAGNSATVGFADLSSLARTLEHALVRSNVIGRGTADEAQLFVDVADEIRRLLHQFAAGFLKSPPASLLERLAAHEVESASRLEHLGLDSVRTGDAEDIAAAADAEPTSRFDTIDSLPGDLVDLPPAPGASDDSRIADPEFDAAPLQVDGPAASADQRDAAADHASGVEADADAHRDADADDAPAGWRQSATSPVPLAVGHLGQAELKSLAALPQDLPKVAPARDAVDEGDEDIDAVDAIDVDLFPIFEEEALDLLPQLASRLQDWAQHPGDPGGAAACMRTLHTLKGGARLAGAMRLGERAHRLESAVERLASQDVATTSDVEQLQARADGLVTAFEALRRTAVATAAPESESAMIDALPATIDEPMPVELETSPPEAIEQALEAVALDLGPDAPSPTDPDTGRAATAMPIGAAPAPAASGARPIRDPADIDWSRFTGAPARRSAATERTAPAAALSVVRVRAPLLERLVNHAGEVSITRSRIEVEVAQLKSSLGDLTDNLERLRGQLRDIELQAETQMASRMEAAKAAAETFDPLEFDRFTRFQELTRMMAESVNDVATVQRTLQRTLEATEDDLAAQSRLTRELQDDLLRTRMVEFESIADRLYRVVRQAAKETGKQVRLDIVGGSIEVDRGVLDRMTGAFEHLLRNCVTHGIEAPQARESKGKEAAGSIVVSLTQEGNEVGVEFRDDGQGLNLLRIRERGVATGLLEAQGTYSDEALANLIFMPGFTTAETVTELAGRGIGMDVVRSEVNAMGGRIETATAWDEGTSFRLVLPLTTAVTQVVMLRSGEAHVAVPATLVEVVRREPQETIDAAYAAGAYEYDGEWLPFFWLGGLLDLDVRGHDASRTQPIVVVRSAQQRIAVHVDDVLGNQEVVVKNLGPQLSRLPGLAGMTLLANGTPTLIYNPVALATLYGGQAQSRVQALRAPAVGSAAELPPVAAAVRAPLVLVVDDSLTVRRVTQRLLVREGFRVALAKDGLEALERLAGERPDVVLSDIEMPRMDGFDLVRNMRGDDRWRDLPVIMITSRIAQKHRDHAAELGVDHYLGKPYSEEDLLALVRSYVAADAAA